MNPALRSTGNPLLDDALEDSYLEDLERGNLKRKKAEPVLSPSWESLGYFAHVDFETCKSCGATNSHLVGVFLRERNIGVPSNIRSTRLSLKAFRDLNIEPQAELLEIPVDLCAECVFAPLTSH